MAGFWDDEYWADEYWGQDFGNDPPHFPAPGAGGTLYWSPLYWNPAYFDPTFWATFRDKVVPATPDQCPPGYWARYYWQNEYWMGQYWPNPCYHLDVGIPEAQAPQEYHGSGKWLREHEADIRRKWDELLELKKKHRERALRGWRTRRAKGLEIRYHDPLWELVQMIQEEMEVDLELAKLAAAAVIAQAFGLAQELQCGEDQAVVLGLEMIEA